MRHIRAIPEIQYNQIANEQGSRQNIPSLNKFGCELYPSVVENVNKKTTQPMHR